MKSREKYNAYMRDYHMKRYRRLREEAISKLGGKCAKCGLSEDLEFDHIDPEDESFETSRMLSVSLKRFWSEVAKCQLLCNACHKEKTLKDAGIVSAKTQHGTLSAYRYCEPPKCDACREAKKLWQREWRSRKSPPKHYR